MQEVVELRYLQTWQNQVTDFHRGLQDIEGVRVATASSRTRSMCIESENTATERYCGVHILPAEFLVYMHVCMDKPLMTCIGDDKIQIWRMHHLIEPTLNR